MSGFSPEWLKLREPADHTARNLTVAASVARHFRDRRSINVVDLGCGAGSNLRGTAPSLPERQHWRLVDYDEDLLAAARRELTAWAETFEAQGDVLMLTKAGKQITVAFRRADLSHDPAAVLDGTVDLVTAAALFDLCSAEWITRFAGVLAARKLPLYTVLTYDGDDRFEPPDPLDGAMLAAFHADMGRDKGFGPAAGPDAARRLIAAFEMQRYVITQGPSPWVLDASERLTQDLARGFVAAVVATGRVETEAAERWLALRLARGTWETGHTDVFALPGVSLRG